MVIIGILWVSSTALWGLEIGLKIQNAQITKQDEGKTDMEFAVVMSATPVVPIEFTYTTSDGTAKAGKDYIYSSGKITIPAHEKRAIIKVPIINNTHYADNKTFNVTIASRLTPVFIAKATGTIIDNDFTKNDSNINSKKGTK